MGRKLERTCGFCGKQFFAEVKKINIGGGKFCSIGCVGKESSKNASGGTTPHSLANYSHKIAILSGMIKDNSSCESCGKIVGTSIDIHHKDRNRKNNSVENITLLCRSCHVVLHNRKKENGRGSALKLPAGVEK